MQAKVKPRGATQTLVVTANRLRDGKVVWLADHAAWTEHVTRAALFAGEQVAAGLAEAAAAEGRQAIVGAYAVEVARTPAGPVPLRMRERLRVDGPSVAYMPQAAE